MLAAIIIPAFVIWGSASVINKSKAPAYAGVIFAKKISFDEFQDAFSAWRTQIKLQYGDKSEEVAATLYNPIQAAWDRLILIYETREKKIKVADAEVIAAITHLPFLQREGNFQPQTYQLFLKYALNEAPKVFEDHLRENLAMAKLFKEVTKDAGVSEEEVRKAYEQQNIQTRIKYAFFPSQGYKDKIAASEDDIKTYYETNKVKFSVPPQINVAYITIEFKEDTPDLVKSETADKIKKAYALSRKKGFHEAARELKLDIKETGLFGFDDPIPTLGWMPQLSTLLFDLPQGALSQIVETERGVYLFKVIEKKDTYIPDFKDTKEKVKDALLNEKSKEMAKQKALSFLAQIKTQGSAFEKAAQEASIDVKETPLFSREAYIPELGMAGPLKEVAFTLKAGEVANDSIELELGFYVVKSIETISVDEEKFKKEKSEFSEQLLDEKRNKIFNSYFENLKTRAGLTSYVDSSNLKKRF